jgi:hypothetical protein
MRQPQPPAPPPAKGRDYQVKIGTNGISVTEPGVPAAEAMQAQAQVLRSRIAQLSGEIEKVKASMSPGTMATDQIRLTSLESRRTDAEEALQKIEDQLALTGIAEVQPESFTGVPPIDRFDPNDPVMWGRIENISIAAIIFIGAPIAIAIARFVWKRTGARLAPAAPSSDDTRRLERVEAAVDAIAVEMERMSEGQRYVTKLLAERAGAPAAEPVAMPQPQGVERR